MRLAQKIPVPMAALLLGALAIVGCKSEDACPEGFICTPDSDAGDTGAQSADTGVDLGADAGASDSGPDAGDIDAGSQDTGPADSGALDMGVDAGPMCASPALAGEEGGVCMPDMSCAMGLDCFAEFSQIPGGPPATLGNVFGLPSGTTDPGNAGEFIAGPPSDVPIAFAPGGVCSTGCNPGVQPDTCGACASCNPSIGPRTFGVVGLDVSVFAAISGGSNMDGICRANCEFDATGATNGGCEVGNACDPQTNTCVEACTSDSQCQLVWGLSRAEGLVAAQAPGMACNATTGLCEIVNPPKGAQLGSACTDDRDCPQHGACFGGRCATFGCASGDGAPGPVPCAGTCVGTTARGSICLPACTTPDECPPEQACIPLQGGAGICFFACQGDAECKADERCKPSTEQTGPQADVSTCSAICDPDPSDQINVPGAIMCPTDSFCVASGMGDHGFCEPLDQLCTSDAACVGAQACEVVDADLLGRCVDGCAVDMDCPGLMEQCVIQAGSTNGVCRAPGGPCSASPDPAGTPQQPLLGDAQCISTERCSQDVATSPRSVANCVPR